MAYWRCCYVDSKGERCKRQAHWRLHFSNDHPFDHTDMCEAHFMLHRYVAWYQNIIDYPQKVEKETTKA